MAEKTYILEIRAVLEAQIAALKATMEAAVREQAARTPSGRDGTRGARGESPSVPHAEDVIDLLDKRAGRLEELRDLITEYPELVPVIDTIIGKQIASSERRQRIQSVTIAIVSLAAGWVLSLVGTPAALVQLLSH